MSMSLGRPGNLLDLAGTPPLPTPFPEEVADQVEYFNHITCVLHLLLRILFTADYILVAIQRTVQHIGQDTIVPLHTTGLLVLR